MSAFEGRTALITGASSGMGVDYARQLARAGANLILVARRADRLEKIRQELLGSASVDVRILTCDLADPAARAALLEQLSGEGCDIDILINNAGLGLQGSFVETGWSELDNMIGVDISALTHLTHHFAERMKARGQGYILLVASVVGHMAVPRYATYSACKAYVRTLGYALNAELADAGVRVTVLSPGATETEFFDVAGHQRNALLKALTASSGSVVEKALSGLLDGKREVVPGLMNWLSVVSAKLMPYALLRPIIARFLA